MHPSVFGNLRVLTAARVTDESDGHGFARLAGPGDRDRSLYGIVAGINAFGAILGAFDVRVIAGLAVVRIGVFIDAILFRGSSHVPLSMKKGRLLPAVPVACPARL